MLNLYGSVLTSIQHLTVVSKHDGSDSTALPNENGQLGVGLLQINIVAFNKLPTKKTYLEYKFQYHLHQPHQTQSNGLLHSYTTQTLNRAAHSQTEKQSVWLPETTTSELRTK